jgi:hypothetical protein
MTSIHECAMHYKFFKRLPDLGKCSGTSLPLKRLLKLDLTFPGKGVNGIRLILMERREGNDDNIFNVVLQ